MKICFLTENLDISQGWGRSIFNLVVGVREKDVDVLALVEEFANLDFERKALSSSIIISAFRSRRFFKESDIINAHDVWPYGVIAFLGSLGLGKKIIITAHGTYSVAPFYEKGIGGFLKKFLGKLVLKSADKIIAVSNFTANEIKKILPELAVEVIHWGVDSKRKCQHKDDRIAEVKGMDIKRLKPYILTVGALKYRKGQHVSLEAFNLIKNEYPDLKYVLVGHYNENDIYKKGLDAQIEKYGIKDKVYFLKDVSDEELAFLYCHSSLFILTAVNEENAFEGFGLVYLEAGAFGKPVIGALGSGAEDAIIDGKTGILVKEGDAKEAKLAMEKILKDASFSEYLGTEGKKRAEEMTWDKTAGNYMKIFKEIYDKKNN